MPGEDLAVGVDVEILGPEEAQHVGDRLGIDEDGAEASLLGLGVVGRNLVLELRRNHRRIDLPARTRAPAAEPRARASAVAVCRGSAAGAYARKADWAARCLRRPPFDARPGTRLRPPRGASCSPEPPRAPRSACAWAWAPLPWTQPSPRWPWMTISRLASSFS